jgi:outer membrane immunogenic protein
MNFGSRNNIVLSGTTAVNLRQDFNEVKVGVNYHFGKDEVVVASGVPVKAPPAPVFNWTGVYVGAAVADRFSFDTWQTSMIADHCAAVFMGFPICATRGGVPDPTTTPSSFFGSNLQGRLYSGYNWQLSQKWVASVEGDAGFGDSQMTRGGIPGTFGNGLRNSFASAGTDAQLVDSSSVKMGWDGTIRGRLGMLVTPTILFYGTGGAAFQEVSVSASCAATPAFSPRGQSWCTKFQGAVEGGVLPPAFGGTGISKSETFSSVRTGWTVGVGVEGVLVGNWLAKFEARYADFGNYKNTFFAGTGDDVATSVRVQTVTAMAGVSYKFAPPGAVLAKY